MPNDQIDGLAHDRHPPLIVNAEVERRAERDFATALFEPPFVDRDHAQIFREIGRVDYGNALRLNILAGSRPMRSREHLPEPFIEFFIRINCVLMKRMEQLIEQRGFGLARRRIGIHLASADLPIISAVRANEQIDARDAVPAALRSEPHRFLPGGKIEELIEQFGMANDDFGEFVIDQPDALGGGSQSFDLWLRKYGWPQSKPFFPAQPRVGKDAGGVEHSSKIAIIERINRHNRRYFTGFS